MSSKFLFLYNTPMQRAELIKCEKVIKALFRKFRKSAVFTYLHVDPEGSSCSSVVASGLTGPM